MDPGRECINNARLIGAASEGSCLPTGVEELRVLLKGFNAQTGSRMSAIVTRSGVAVASALPEGMQADNFATMAATLLGALEVIYSALQGPSPQRVFVETENGALAVRVVTSKMFFVALTNGRATEIQPAVDEAATRARALLAKGS